ncbi:heparan-alpha-glucosaminide N-acetyltransferase domain-containing protein [Aquimarina algicola]|uniref:DUF1624 domain-containing protein n=1 Tax=Aquimarina algicola TaxID=2589995 RepID=A0A504JHJ3_9FLAO|nr:heparan-alpha-glucosaminide N-acetyltransferase domain-containing protein [Aquimarina algicola]TPN85921.1 DUF1624 domain-containing protein [Aquimarina algicola]
MMNKSANRLHFLDAIRSFAILMMLQGHFVHALLGTEYRDNDNAIYSIWSYLRGMTAPTFFTITGFIFTFLLLKNKMTGLQNPRVLKGIRRAVKVIFWGYLLRLSFFAISRGTLNPSFFYVDVLQCIGTSLLLLIGVYLLFYRKDKDWFQRIVLCLGILIFILQPMYGKCILEFLPKTIANYFTNRNGSIFTLFPWFGYVCFGSFMGTVFLKYKEQAQFYLYAKVVLMSIGVLLVYFSSDILMILYRFTDVIVFKSVAYNNFLFIRLGNVCILFAVFLMLKNYFSDGITTKIGGNTLSIYIVHFFVLYGSWFGLGLNRFFHRQLTPLQTFVGAILFVFCVCVIVLSYYRNEDQIKSKVNDFKNRILTVIPDSFLIEINDILQKVKKLRYIKR